MIRNALCSLALLAAPVASAAEVELSFYTGGQSAPHSDVFFSGDATIPDSDHFIGWEGRSFSPPPYYGLRATWWRSETLGYGVDFAHNKIYPQEGDLPDGFGRLEFTDGLNTLTVNAYRRWPGQWGAYTPYVGGGVGLSIPYVEVDYGGDSTRGYQVTGPAITWIAGVKYDVTERWALFGEYKGTYTMNEGDLEGGGTVSTDVITNALNLGISYSF